MWTTPRQWHTNRVCQAWKYLKVQTIISILVAKSFSLFRIRKLVFVCAFCSMICSLEDDVFCALYLANKWSTSYWSREVTVTSRASSLFLCLLSSGPYQWARWFEPMAAPYTIHTRSGCALHGKTQSCIQCDEDMEAQPYNYSQYITQLYSASPIQLSSF